MAIRDAVISDEKDNDVVLQSVAARLGVGPPPSVPSSSRM